jgi:hypothetical protein
MSNPDRSISTFSILPSPKVSDFVVEPYTIGFTLRKLAEFADICHVLDNGVYFDLCTAKLGLNPSLEDLNELVAQDLCGATSGAETCASSPPTWWLLPSSSLCPSVPVRLRPLRVVRRRWLFQSQNLSGSRCSGRDLPLRQLGDTELLLAAGLSEATVSQRESCTRLAPRCFSSSR